MATKRSLDESKTDPDQANGKRIRTKPSFASVIRQVVIRNFLENCCLKLEPMMRRVVNEEIEHALRRGGRSLTRSSSLRIQALEPPSLKLMFRKSLSSTIFTGSKLMDSENSSLQILLANTTDHQLVLQTDLSYAIKKVEIVVLDGEFPPGGGDTWTSEEFDKNIVRERAGKRPLLTGDLQVIMRDGVAAVGEIEFTDNSSWIRSRKFRLGARVVQGSSQGAVRVREAMTEPFVVKDHRGELYRKHYPPMLEDEVWRLKKIGKDGAFHKKLTSEGIETVQEFLKLSIVNPNKLRMILGPGMSNKMWEVTIKHARTCIMGNKLYIFKGLDYTIFLDPICQLVKAVINGQTLSTQNLTTSNRAYLEKLVRDAYVNWKSLEEVDGLLNETPQLTQGDRMEQYPINHNESMARSYQQQQVFLTDGSSIEVASVPSDAHMEDCNDWLLNSPFLTLLLNPFDSGARYNISESSLDGECPLGPSSTKVDN